MPAYLDMSAEACDLFTSLAQHRTLSWRLSLDICVSLSPGEIAFSTWEWEWIVQFVNWTCQSSDLTITVFVLQCLLSCIQKSNLSTQPPFTSKNNTNEVSGYL